MKNKTNPGSRGQQGTTGAYREGGEGTEKRAIPEMPSLLARHPVSTEWITERQKCTVSWGTHGRSSRGPEPSHGATVPPCGNMRNHLRSSQMRGRCKSLTPLKRAFPPARDRQPECPSHSRHGGSKLEMTAPACQQLSLVATAEASTAVAGEPT